MFIEFLQVQSPFNFSFFFSSVNILEMYLPSKFSACSMATLSKRLFLSFETAFNFSQHKGSSIEVYLQLTLNQILYENLPQDLDFLLLVT